MTAASSGRKPETSLPVGTAPLVICEHCDAVYRRRALARGEKARCLRCGAVLYRHPLLTPGSVLALAISGLIVWLIANLSPVFTASVSGIHGTTTLLGAIITTWEQHARLVAVLAALTLFIAPLLQLLMLAWVCGISAAGHRPAGLAPITRMLRFVRPWSMVEVWVLGTIVAVVKLQSVFDVHVGIGMWAFGALMILMTLLATWDTDALWEGLGDMRS